MSLGKRGSGIQRDSSTFTLMKFNTKTNNRPIEGQKSIVGAAKAELAYKEAMRDRTRQEIEEGWTWLLEPHSQVAGRRLDFGFQRDRN